MRYLFQSIYRAISWRISRAWVWLLAHAKAMHAAQRAASFAIEPTQEDPWHRRWYNVRSLAMLLAATVIMLGGYVLWVQPPAGFPVEQLVTVTKGNSLKAVAQELYEQSVIKSPRAFEILLRLQGGERSVHAGDYLFRKPANLFAVARAIRTGAFGLEPVRVTIPEGATVAEMARLYERALLRFDADTFMELAKDDEGYLFPDTYYFLPNATEEEVYTAMRDNFKRKIKTLEKELEAFDKPLEEVITMASIVEKEAWNFRDQRLIAGVLWKRLKIGMPLQVDATFVYTHQKGSSQITMAELTDKENPYNTYVHKGLPPTPIGNPGLAAIKATLTPIASPYLFYLADKTGVTHFSRTYREHMQKRAKYIDF